MKVVVLLIAKATIYCLLCNLLNKIQGNLKSVSGDQMRLLSSSFIVLGIILFSSISSATTLASSGSIVASGYAWINDPTASESSPSAPYAFNSAGEPIDVSRLNIGLYRVRFHGLGGNGTVGATVQVTPYGEGYHSCRVLGWNSSENNLDAYVQCQDPSARAKMDGMFTIYVAWGKKL